MVRSLLGANLAADTTESDLLALLRLGGGLPDRLVATVVAAWAERVGRAAPEVDGAEAALHAAVYGQATAAVRGWLGQHGLVVDVEMDNSSPGTIGRSGTGVALTLPFWWLRDVWVKGLATIVGHPEEHRAGAAGLHVRALAHSFARSHAHEAPALAGGEHSR